MLFYISYYFTTSTATTGQNQAVWILMTNNNIGSEKIMLIIERFDECQAAFKNGCCEKWPQITIVIVHMSSSNYHKSTILISKYMFWWWEIVKS